MSAVSKGKKLAGTAQQATEALEPGVVTSAPDTKTNVQGGAIAGQFQRKFQTRSARDDMVRMKQQLMNADGTSPFGTVEASDADFRWMADKAKAAEAANFDAWFGQHFDLNDLASRQWAQEVNPEYYKERERLILDKAKMAARIRTIQLRGPQSEEDLMLMWALNSGRVKLDNDWDRIGPVVTTPGQYNRAQQRDTFKRGLFSIPTLQSRRRRAGQLAQPANRPFRQGGDASAAFPVTSAGVAQGRVFADFMNRYVAPAVQQ
ncbi:MAG: hypothetical protein ACPGR8_06425 [Limisphaerales bacterium]